MARKFDYKHDKDFIECFARHNGDVDGMNGDFSNKEAPYSEATLNARRFALAKLYDIKLKKRRTSKFNRMDVAEFRSLAKELGISE